MTNHSFDIHIATEYKSVELAILVWHFQYWIMKNKRLGKNQMEGRTWTFQSIKEIAAVFPYWSIKQVERLIVKAVDANILIRGNFNKSPYDRTVWYAFKNEEKFGISRFREMENPESGNQFPEIGTPIPNTLTYTLKDKIGSQHPLRPLASFFFEQVKRVNPKVKAPNLDKWAKELEMLIKDGNSEEEVRKVMLYLASTASKPSNNGFTWANNVLSPTKLRKHFAALWGEMNVVKNLSSTQKVETDEELAIKIAKAFPERIKSGDISLGHNYIEFNNGMTVENLTYGTKDFREKCLHQLKKRGLKHEL